MKTVRMFGRSVTLYRSPMTAVVKHGGQESRFPVMAYTAEEAEAQGLRAFHTAHPGAVLDSVSSEIGHHP
jgi:hypothetical protein